MNSKGLSWFAALVLIVTVACRPGDAYEPDDSIDEASQIGEGESQSRSFHTSADVDYVRFEGTAGYLYRFTADPADEDLDTTLTVLDESGEELAFNDDYDGLGSQVELALTHGGVVYLVVDRYADSPQGDYALSVADAGTPDAFEPDDSAAEANAHEPGTTHAHSLHSSLDEDWEWIATTPGLVYVAQAFVSADASTAPAVEIYDADQSLVDRAASAEPGGGAHVEWRAEGDRYYLRVYPADLSGAVSLGDYQLLLAEVESEVTVYEPDVYEPDNGLASASRIKPGEPQSRTLHLASDEDYVRFEGEVGSTYVISTAIPGDASTDAVLEILSPTGAILAADDDGGPSGDLLSFSPGEAGGFYIRVSPFDAQSAGPYTLRFEVE